MKREDFDWKILRGSIVVLVVSIVVSGILVYGSYYFQKQMNRDYSRNDARFQSISRRYLAVDEEEKLIKEYYPRFIELYNKGVIGKEQRLNWLEVLRTTGLEMVVPGLSYQIKSQDTYTPSYSVTLGHFKIFSSKMTLNMRLLHEGDLFGILNRLDENAKGIYSLNSCQLSQRGSIVENADAPNINAVCELQWFTINLASGKDLNI
jgi:hypothetical protein